MKKILVAKIISAHGIKGDIKIINYCKTIKDLQNFELFDAKDNAVKFKNLGKKPVGSDNFGNAIFITKIEGIDNRNKAEEIAQSEIFTDRKNFPAPKNNEYYQVDLIDLDVIDENGKVIGKTTNLFDFGGGTSVEIEFLQVNKDNGLGKVENFPFKDEFFPNVDVESGKIEFVMPEIVEMEKISDED